MIKIKKTDSIVDIILKMKEEKGEKIILDFPFGHSILHNYTSLKILKNKAEQKELIISTNDLTAKKIGKKLGIKYSITSNEDVIKHNYTFWEYLIYTLKSSFKNASDTILEKGKNSSIYKYHKFQDDGKISYFIAFLIVSILLLFLVFYFAVNKTYVYIKPEIDIRERARNIIFKDIEEFDTIEDDNIIKVKKITNTVNLSETFGTSGAKSDSIFNATGTVILYNLLKEEVSLIKNSRLQTKDGQVFILDSDVYIPAAKKENGKIIPGEKQVQVAARLKNADGDITGKKGNIKKGTFLSFPGLKETKEQIYAIAHSDFTGGSDSYVRVLSEEDLQNAKQILRKKLERLGIDKLRKDLRKENKVNDVNYNILEIDGAIQYSDFEVTGVEKLKIGEEMKKFEIFGTIKTTSYIYNRELLLSKIKKSINENLMEGVEGLTHIDKDSLKIILELRRKDNPFEIKTTVQVEAFFTQNFLSEKSDYIEKLKNMIAGKSKQEAEKILVNNEKIASARVQIRPFFIHTISKLIENIEFKIEK